MADSINLLLFGYPKLQWHGQPLETALPKKAVALLAYLSVADGPIGRETAETLLWPDVPPKIAKQSLRNLLSQLRKELPSLLAITARSITVEPAFAEAIDVVRFQRGLAAIRTAQRNSQTSDLQLWQATLDLYQDEFLAGFHIHQSATFDEWAVLQREYLHEQTTANLLALSEAYAAADNVDLALATLTRLLALEPWHEAAHLQQFHLLQASGQRMTALQHYDRYRRLLADEFGVEPAAELTTLYQQIKRGGLTGFGSPRPPAPRTEQRGTQSTDRSLTVGTIPNNLHYPLRVFFGRKTELALIQQLITNPACRLLSIVGAGGMGKTTLAEEVGLQLLRSHADDFPDGIFFVSLSGIELGEKQPTDHEASVYQSRSEQKAHAGDHPPKDASGKHSNSQEAIAAAIAKSIGCDMPRQIPPLAQLQAYLRPKRLLLILDNFEQLLAGAGTVVALLTRAPELSMIVTSRFVLAVQGETILTLDRLSLPSASSWVHEDSAQRNGHGVASMSVHQANKAASAVNHLLAESEAAAMFVQRVQRYNPHFVLDAQTIGAVARICHLVEGLPLGLELAAGISPALGCKTLATELAQGLDLLALETADLPATQRSLWVVFERSWQLLIPQEQHLLAKLSRFPSSFDLAAATAVAGASIPLLLRLINYSLLSRVGDDRYAMHRTIREFADKQLQQWPDLATAVQVQFVRYYLAFFDQQRPILQGKEHAAAVARIFTELDNIRVAWRWAANRRMTAELNGCARVHFLFYEPQGLYTEAGELYEHTLQQFSTADEQQQERPDDDVNLLVGRLQSYLGAIHAHFGRFDKAVVTFRASLARLQQAGDPCDSAFCLALWGALTRVTDLEEAKTLALQAIPLVQGVNPYYESFAYITLGETNRMLGAYDDAARCISTGHRLAQQIDWTWGVANSQRLLGQLHISQGNYAVAETALRDCINLTRERRLQLLLMDATVMLGKALQLQARLAEAQNCYAESLQLAEELQLHSVSALAHWAQGSLAEQQEKYATAKALFTDSLATGNVVQANKMLPTLGWALIGLGELEAAQHYFEQVCVEAQRRHAMPVCLDAQVGLAYLRGLHAKQVTQPDQTQWPEVVSMLQFVERHPAATQETRQRIADVTTKLDL